MANPGDQGGQHGNQHGSNDEGQQNLDSDMAAYAHSADQSMGYLETEQQGQTEHYGDEPFGAYEHGGAMNADSDRYTPTHSPDQTRLPDDTGEPGAGPWATVPPDSQAVGANEQAMPAEYAAWHPPAVSAPGMSANPGQPIADELRARELRQTNETTRVPVNPNVRPGAPLPPEVVEQQGQPRQPGIYTGQQQIASAPEASSGRQSEMRESESSGGDTGQANPAPMPQVDTDAPTTEQANREHGAPLGPVPGTGQSAGGAGEDAGGSAGQPREAGGSRGVTGGGQPEVASRRVPITGETAEQGQARQPRIEPAPPGGSAPAEQVLRRDTQEMERQERAQGGAVGESPGGRTQPVGTVRPTDKHAEALLDARTRVHDAIDQLASQIPYGEEFAQQAKEAADTALDRMEAQALQRDAELRHDLTATP